MLGSFPNAQAINARIRPRIRTSISSVQRQPPPPKLMLDPAGSGALIKGGNVFSGSFGGLANGAGKPLVDRHAIALQYQEKQTQPVAAPVAAPVAVPVAAPAPAGRAAVPLGAGNMTLSERWSQMPSRQVQQPTQQNLPAAQQPKGQNGWMNGASELDSVLKNALYSPTDIARNSNRYMAAGQQSAASAMAQPAAYSGFAADSPGLLYGNTMQAAQAIGGGKQGQLQSQLADAMANADYLLQGQQARGNDILAQKSTKADRRGAKLKFQQGMADIEATKLANRMAAATAGANSQLTNIANQIAAARNNALVGLDDSSWWGGYGVQGDRLNQGNLMSMLQAMMNWGAV